MTPLQHDNNKNPTLHVLTAGVFVTRVHNLISAVYTGHFRVSRATHNPVQFHASVPVMTPRTHWSSCDSSLHVKI